MELLSRKFFQNLKSFREGFQKVIHFEVIKKARDKEMFNEFKVNYRPRKLFLSLLVITMLKFYLMNWRKFTVHLEN